MNPGLAVTLRPVTPWRIGPDSGVRNRVDSVFHSDTLYSAVASAMARLGRLDEWLAATARSAQPAVCFSSCFPCIDGVRYVAPPRHVWPPSSPALLSARVRWKSAKFVPVEIVRAVLAGKPLREDQWTVDGVSGCLLPEGAAAPVRTSLRWSAAVDRLTGSTDRHSVACTEFRPGAGLWVLVSFAGDSAHAAWAEPVKAAFRWLADSGFGGERSRGWGRAEAPEFFEGQLPGMILGSQEPDESADAGEPVEHHHKAEVIVLPVSVEPIDESAPLAVAAAAPVGAPSEAPADPGVPDAQPEPQSATTAAAIAIPAPPDPALGAAEPSDESLPPATAPIGLTAHWLLSLFTPAENDSVDWSRGNYALIERSGRIDSPAGAGDLKRNVRMVAEGSVVYATSAPCGAAPDVAPEGFPHPVYRAGFALSIPLLAEAAQ
jgi:CRISPR type III-A-associated RAMP protein Csm4